MPHHRTLRIGLLLFFACYLSSCTLSRRLTLNAPDFQDQLRFAHTEIPPAASNFSFSRPPAKSEIGQSIQVVPIPFGLGTVGMEEYLNNSATQAFIIIRNDTVLYEQYFREISANHPVTSFSIAKTFVGAMISIALEEGSIHSLKDPVQRYVSDFPFEDVTLEHLLNHTSGIRYPAEGWLYYCNHIDRICEKKFDRRAEPGQTFRYENGNTQMLSMVLEVATGIEPVEYLSQKIWSRIGTENALRWSTDKGGTPKAFCCLNATAMDFARFGRLMLNRGNWNGEQIIPASYFDVPPAEERPEGSFARYYNHMWLEGEDAGIYFAAGLYGQYIYVYPPKNILIVRFAKENLHLHAVWSEFFQTIIAQL